MSASFPSVHTGSIVSALPDGSVNVGDVNISYDGAICFTTPLVTARLDRALNGTSPAGDLGGVNASDAVVPTQKAVRDFVCCTYTPDYNLGYYCFSDTKSSGVQGGASVTGSWTTLTLNTTNYSHPPGHVTLASSTLSMVPGSYYIDASCRKCGLNKFGFRMRQTNGAGEVVLVGETSVTSGTSTGISYSASLKGVIVADVDPLSTYVFEYYTENEVLIYGLGRANAITGLSEVYMTVVVKKF